MSRLSSIWEAGLAGAEGVLVRAEDQLGDLLRTTRFLRGRAGFRSRPDDVYVVTYPRSGTTWVQFILYLLSSDRSMDFEHISQVAPWWERSLALASRRPEDFDRLRSPRVFKSHLPRRWLPDEGRFIYVTRDGFDVAISYYQFYCSHLGYRGDLESFFARFLAGKLQYGSWFKHVEGWQRFGAGPQVLMLSYEALCTDLSGTVRRLAAFLNWSVDDETLDEVVGKASFDFMKQHESRFDPITETLMEQGLQRGRFIREGRPGQGRGALTEGLRAKFESTRTRSRRRPDIETRIADFLH